MWLSAVSVGVAILGVNPQARLSDKEQALWKRMEPAIVMVLDKGRATGPAALIDETGLFIAHRSAVSGGQVDARTVAGQAIRLVVRSEDPITQLVLLESKEWRGGARPFSAPRAGVNPGGSLLAVLSTGPIRAEFVSSDRMGVVKQAQRMVPLTEFRFEAPAEAVGTALVFSENGEFLGALHATLGRPETAANTLGNTLSGGNTVGDLLNRLPGVRGAQIGPSELTVAYTAGPDLVRRALAGFRSDSREVDYPSLGVFVRDNPGGGALVQQVTPDSAAAKAGVRPGDVIVDIGGNLIRSQVDFARVMVNQNVGAKITIRVRRGQQLHLLDAVVHKAD
jgi:putative serine protease PepD